MSVPHEESLGILSAATDAYRGKNSITQHLIFFGGYLVAEVKKHPAEEAKPENTAIHLHLKYSF